MTSYEIEAFLAVVKHESLTKAAEAIHISQPALSKRISQLEAKLGFPLIIRQKGVRKVKLTEKGNSFISIANRFKDIWSDVKSLDTIKQYNLFHIASSDGPHLYVLSKVYTEMIKRFPNLALRLKTLNYRECYQRVATGSVEVALVGANYYFKGVTSLPAYSEKMHFICRTDSDYPDIVEPNMLSVSNSVYSPYSAEYMIWFDYWFKTRNEPLIETDLILLVEDFLTSLNKNIWTFVPSSALEYFLKNPLLITRKFINNPPDRNIFLISKPDHESEYMEAFTEILKNTINGLDGVKLLLP
ncbi:LysR family transcriptional regulator [Bacillus sp. FJAT-29937]|uniref:LysR family transcriptional regulator n=1 Tax=Bacillus sp. FJAT-29937 TaxID=1720553 RepID=UPI00082AE50C|nr:LysR family transcriptional regulator [Bacillus sp. FJAT-29937]